MTSTCPEAAFPTFCELPYVCICSWIILCWGSCARHCGMFGSNPWSLSSRCQQHPQHCDNKMHPDITRGPTQTPWRATAALTPGRTQEPQLYSGSPGAWLLPQANEISSSGIASDFQWLLKEQHSLSQRMPLSSVGGTHSLPSGA